MLSDVAQIQQGNQLSIGSSSLQRSNVHSPLHGLHMGSTKSSLSTMVAWPHRFGGSPVGPCKDICCGEQHVHIGVVSYGHRQEPLHRDYYKTREKYFGRTSSLMFNLDEHTKKNKQKATNSQEKSHWSTAFNFPI